MGEQRLTEQFQLRSRLRFDIDSGQIWLDDNRMLLVHAKALGALRRELFESLGTSRAQGLLLRMGFVSGQHDADLALKLEGRGDPYDVFRIGPELHGFEGLVKATVLESKIDWQEGRFEGQVEWRHSWEAESHIQHYGIGEEPACWNLIGYASGFTSRFFKRFIVFRETQCIRQGHDRCVIEGRTADAWEDDQDYVDYFRSIGGPDELRGVEEELRLLRGRPRSPDDRGALVGQSPAFIEAFDLLRQSASAPITVLLLGETGVGKEMFARWLHEHGPRANKPFVAVNCAAIPQDLVESELFGVRKGAFTGAQDSRPGRFERADGGTLFLDEIGELSLAAQAKLLRVLQSGEVERLGDAQSRRVDVRLIAATNVDLHAAVAAGKFRADLYYRIATFPVEIPPLRDRRIDIPLLAAALIEKYQGRYGKTGLDLSERASQSIKAHPWPGNVRELENAIERGVLLAPSGGEIEVQHLFAGTPPGLSVGVTLGASGRVSDPDVADQTHTLDALLGAGFDLDRHEAQLIERAMQRSGGNLTHAAKLLGITRRQLGYRLKRDAGSSAE
ncbi:MAG: sigma-54-dependent Fis family transcriptional regulator [Panacagrimonas sp.]|nr:sigma-54-dependent Fis family transcriptional regulator [Panacagrimonas sp.]MCC2657521.1 sigma-54-dependent Fis family transcriptional regulator [Panacagrimonas sp.]